MMRNKIKLFFFLIKLKFLIKSNVNSPIKITKVDSLCCKQHICTVGVTIKANTEASARGHVSSRSMLSQRGKGGRQRRHLHESPSTELQSKSDECICKKRHGNPTTCAQSAARRRSPFCGSHGAILQLIKMHSSPVYGQ